MGARVRILILFSLFNILFLRFASGITLEEALTRALSVSYTLKEQEEMIKKSRFFYLSTIDPYLPRFDLKGSYARIISPSTYTASSRENYSLCTVISYRIFDGGERYSRRKGAYFSYEKDMEKLKSIRQEVAYIVKKYFYEALGKREIVKTKEESFEKAKKVFELTRGRYEAGIAKKSDVLQAQLRMESALIEYENAKKEYEKSLESLASYLLLDQLQTLHVEGSLEKPDFKMDVNEIIKKALTSKPEILAQKNEIKRLEMAYKEKESSWYPKIDAEIQHQRQDTVFFPKIRSDQFVISFVLPIFDGFGRYYSLKGVKSEISAAKAKLEEMKRETESQIKTAFIEYGMSLRNVELYEKLVEEAKVNFEQLLGEYQVGKGDILSLLNSEKDLASAKERYLRSLMEANISLFYLEKVAYLKEY